MKTPAVRLKSNSRKSKYNWLAGELAVAKPRVAAVKRITPLEDSR
jgi:hypothetical protein